MNLNEFIEFSGRMHKNLPYYRAIDEIKAAAARLPSETLSGAEPVVRSLASENGIPVSCKTFMHVCCVVFGTPDEHITAKRRRLAFCWPLVLADLTARLGCQSVSEMRVMCGVLRKTL